MLYTDNHLHFLQPTKQASVFFFNVDKVIFGRYRVVFPTDCKRNVWMVAVAWQLEVPL